MCSIPKRVIFTIMAFFACVVMYSSRMGLSVAMVAMVNPSQELESGEAFSSGLCANQGRNETNASIIESVGEKYDWDLKTQGVILSSFYYGYVVTQLPGGILCDRLGAKSLIGGGILVTSLLFMLIPFAASWSVSALVVIRILEGLLEGITFPAITHALSNWAPRCERSRISSLICMGASFASIISAPLSGFLSSTDLFGGWPSIFYLFGSVGCIWSLLWCIFIYETPEDHPHITKKELVFIQLNKDEKPQKKVVIPWKKIFLSLPVWAVIIAHFGQYYSFLLFLTLMPTYFKTILRFDIKTIGMASALPYLFLGVSMLLSSYLADRLRKWNKVSISTIRKTANSIGFAGPALCCLGIVASTCNRELIVGLLCLSMFLNGFIFSGFHITHVDMSPDFSGILYGITNTVANTAGIVSPMIVGVLTSTGETVENWNTVFYLVCVVYITTGIFFALFASADVQPWGLAARCISISIKMEKPQILKIGL